MIRRSFILAALIALCATDAPAQQLGDFRKAQDLLRAGRVAQAAEILAPLVEKYPQFPRIQLDYALALFRLGRDAEARDVFLDVRDTPDLPAAVRRNIEDFLARIRARDPLQINFDFGLWHDPNVNNASEAETVDIPIFGTTLPFTLNERPEAGLGGPHRSQYSLAQAGVAADPYRDHRLGRAQHRDRRT